jgi:hypothetical protein
MKINTSVGIRGLRMREPGIIFAVEILRLSPGQTSDSRVR